jgi:hypothetical protein
MAPKSQGSAKRRRVLGTRTGGLIRVSTLAAALAFAGCAAHPGADRYAVGARLSFIEACIDALDDTGPRRATVYLAFDGQLLTVPDYCAQLAYLRQRR